MYKFKFFKVFILFLMLFSFSQAVEIYHVNITESFPKTKIYNLSSSIFKEKEKALIKKYKLDNLKGKKQLTANERRRVLAFQMEREYYRAQILNNTYRILSQLANKFGKKYGYGVVLSERYVIYVKPKYDKTKEFINFVNREVSKNKNKFISEIKKFK